MVLPYWMVVAIGVFAFNGMTWVRETPLKHAL